MCDYGIVLSDQAATWLQSRSLILLLLTYFTWLAAHRVRDGSVFPVQVVIV